MSYLLLKTIHIISATILFGTGIGSAFFMFAANRRRDIAAIYFATRHVVIADWLFTAPSGIIQLITGIALARTLSITLTENWLLWSLILYFFAMSCWLPVVWLQIRMRDIAKNCLETGSALPEKYWKFDLWWISLGSMAFPAMIAVITLMVTKP